MINFSIEELMSKTNINNKYELTRLAIQRTKELVKEKDKKALLNSQEKIPTIVLKEMMEGKIKPVHLKEELKNNREESSLPYPGEEL